MSKLERIFEEIVLENIGLNLKKRTVGIIVAENELSLSQKNLSAVVNAVKDGITSTQNNAVVLNIPPVSDDITAGTVANKYALPMRDSVADIVECYGAHNNIDGFIFVANQPLTIAGMLIGCLRVNKPSLFVSGGFMPTAVYNGKRTGFNASYSYMGLTNTGELSAFDIEKLKGEIITSFACASDSYAANSGNIMAEALGLALEGNSTLLSNSNKRLLFARKSGERIIKMIDNIVTPKMIVTESALNTALAVDLSLGSSSTSILNILALAKTIEIKFNLNSISEFSKKIPCLYSISETSQQFMEDFAAAGGVYGIISELAKANLISTKYTAYTNQSMQSLLKTAEFKAPAVSKRTPLRVINGNLAEDGAVSFQNETSTFTGKAKVYVNEELAFEAVANREVSKGDVLVIKNEGPVSGPGMREIILPVALLRGLNLDTEIAVITDGRIQNISRGIVVGNISPETCEEEGALQLVQANDQITIDLVKGKITLDVPNKDLQKRKRITDCAKREKHDNYLSRYASVAGSASEGALMENK